MLKAKKQQQQHSSTTVPSATTSSSIGYSGSGGYSSTTIGLSSVMATTSGSGVGSTVTWAPTPTGLHSKHNASQQQGSEIDRIMAKIEQA